MGSMSRPPGARDGTRYGDDGGSRSVRPAWIEVIAEEAAEGELAELYDGLRSPQTGRVDHVMAIHSLHPQTMRDHAQLYRTLMDGKGGLSRPRAREDRRRRLGRQPPPPLTASPRGRSWPPHRTDEARPRPALADDFRSAPLSERSWRSASTRSSSPCSPGRWSARISTRCARRALGSRHPRRQPDHVLHRLREPPRGRAGHRARGRRRRPRMVRDARVSRGHVRRRC